MNSIWKVWRVFLLQLRRELICWRSIMLFVIIGIFVYTNMEPVAMIAYTVGIKATPTGFVHLMNDYICQTIITIGLIFLLSNAPFRRESFPYIVYRSGEWQWELANMLYLITMALFYTVFLLLISVLGLKGQVDFSMDSWGKIWGTLARTNAFHQFGVKVNVDNYLVGKYEPFQAMICTFFLTWMCFVWIGLLIYLTNRLVKKGAGVVVAGVFVFLDVMIYNSWSPWAYRFSPLSLAKLTTFTNYNSHYGLSLSYAWIFLGVSIVVMFIGIMLLIKRKEQSYE